MKGDRKKFRWKERKFKQRQDKRKAGGVLKHDPLMGSTQAKGIVVEKVGIEAKQPNSGIRKAVKISLIRTGNKRLPSRRGTAPYHSSTSTTRSWSRGSAEEWAGRTVTYQVSGSR